MVTDWRGYPQGDAQECVVFRRYMDVPSKNAAGSGGLAHRAGMRPGVFLLVTFLCTSKEKFLNSRMAGQSNSRTKGARKAFMATGQTFFLADSLWDVEEKASVCCAAGFLLVAAKGTKTAPPDACR